MPAFLSAINRILDIKIVQWALLGSVLLLSGILIFSQIRYNGLKLQYTLLETKYSKLDSTLAVQNQKIQEADAAVEQYKLNAAQAKQNEIKISQINEANKRKLKAFQFKPNSTCDEKVHQIFDQYSTLRNK